MGRGAATLLVRRLAIAAGFVACFGSPALANDVDVNAVIQGVPGTLAPARPPAVQVYPQDTQTPAPSDARINAIIQGLRPKSKASEVTVSISRSDFLLQLNLHYERSAEQASRDFRVGQIVPGSVALVEVPGRLTVIWSEARNYLVLPTRASILLIEKNTRKVAFVVNRETYFVMTPDPFVRIILDTRSNRFCVVDFKASASWNIQFAYNSDKLLPEARNDLQEVVRSLRDASWGNLKFFVTGHTDAVGSRSYNYDLSLRRAKSVVDHLVWSESVPSGRVSWSGRGFDELLYPNDPRNPRNRRVNLHPTLHEC